MVRRRTLALGAVLILAVIGCDSRTRPRSASGAPSASGSDALPLPATPSETVTYVQRLRSERRYGRLRDFLEPEHATAIIDFLLAMDELLAANAEVQAALHRHAPQVNAAQWDLAELQYAQGLFAEPIEIVDERGDDRSADVTIQVAGRLPLETVPMRRRGDRWVYAPETGPGDMPEALRGVARGLHRIARAIEGGATTEEAVRDEFRTRISPKLEAVAAAAASNDAP